jgi:endonuclease YncB( thermonuclease family)
MVQYDVKQTERVIIMKKIRLILLIVLSIFLTSCVTVYSNTVVLPDLKGNTKETVVTELDQLEIAYRFEYTKTSDEYFDGFFAGYKGYNSNDSFPVDESLIVYIYQYQSDEETSLYFQVLDLEYDGPYLSESFQDINYLDPRGGYFEVTLKYCTDGDTGVFNYPNDVYEAITSNAKSVRFLNMDTEETYSGGEEEWGKPASLYTCSLLTSAESIIIQTDPGDNLLGTYGRLLGWIWVQLPDEEEYFLLNYMVVKQGLAQVKYEFGAGETIYYGEHSYNEWMHIAEDYAKQEKLGQWSDLLDYYWDYDKDQPDYSKWID